MTANDGLTAYLYLTKLNLPLDYSKQLLQLSVFYIIFVDK